MRCDAVARRLRLDNAFAAYKRVRSSAALSGSLPVRITVMLTATHAGPCPNLGDDMRCAIYDARPLVCRIYPAEVNPFVPLVPDGKQCTPDAWQQAPFVRGGTIVDADTRENIARSRAASEAETPLRARLCAMLGIDTAAVANEGFAVHAPPAAALLAALTALTAQRAAESAPASADAAIAWTLVSNRTSTLDALVSVGAAAQRAGSANPHASYLGFHPDE